MKRRLILLFLVRFFSTEFVLSQTADTLVLTRGLVMRLPRGSADVVIAPNPVEAALASDEWEIPESGKCLIFPNGEELMWTTLASGEGGWFDDTALLGSYVDFTIHEQQGRVMLLEAMGNEMVYVNGSPRPGNPYCLKDTWEAWEPHFDYSLLPIRLERGNNELLFRCVRGRLKVNIVRPAKSVMFNARDVTLPDLIVGTRTEMWGAIVIINATDAVARNLRIHAVLGGVPGDTSHVPPIPPMSVRKIPFRIARKAADAPGVMPVVLSLIAGSKGHAKLLDTTTLSLSILPPGVNRKETFISTVDGSVQYYGILPPLGADDTNPKALFLSLHGAAVEAINQSGSYSAKKWGYIVAPTNRRPYGFNWEEWGRVDAIEVLDLVKERYPIDEGRVYLTGHSMGGHGTWHLGSLFPDRFAAIGPSAGWISFWTYRFRGQAMLDTTPVRRMIRRATAPSETFQHLPNYRQFGVYVLHGSEDDNVPPDQARSMVEKLQSFNQDLVYHEERGAGHWWDRSDEPGVDCVDWAPMFDYFARHVRPGKSQRREISFLTMNPGISSRSAWLTIDAQIEQLKPSSVNVRFDPGLHRLTGSTTNVLRLGFDNDIRNLLDTLTVELDSQRLIVPPAGQNQKYVWLEKRNGQWEIPVNNPSPSRKGAHRNGTWKEVLRNRVIFVYGTGGTREERQWTFGKARFDAEKLWYQGNSSIDVMADVDFDPSSEPDRNIVLYGNFNTNSAWKKLLSSSPIQVHHGYVTVGSHRYTGDDLCCMVVRPRPGSGTASVAAVSGTGIHGMKLANRLPYLNPGIGLPDCTVCNPDILTKGDTGVIMTGFFGEDWSLERGEFVTGGTR